MSQIISETFNERKREIMSNMFSECTMTSACDGTCTRTYPLPLKRTVQYVITDNVNLGRFGRGLLGFNIDRSFQDLA